MTLTFGSLFSGLGGIDTALEYVGTECVWQVERDDDCNRVLAHHWPTTRRVNDVNRLRAYLEPKNDRRPLPWVVRPDIVCGGFPCQDLSVAGKRAGLAGGRSGLWFVFRRIIGLLRPRWVLVENVPGLLSSNAGRDMGTILGALGQLGYGWAYRSLDAQFFGVPQRRRRVFIVGCLGDIARAAAVLFEPGSCDGDSPPRREERKGVAGGAETGFSESGQGWWRDGIGTIRAEGENRPSRPSNVVFQATGAGSERAGMPTVAASDDNGSNQCVIAHTLRSEGADASEDGTGIGTPLVVAETLQAHHQRNSDEPLTFGFNTGRGGQNDIGWTEDGVPPITRRNGDPGGICKGMAVRRLTPLECLRLQGLPDTWLDLSPPLSDSAKYRMIGNSVAVPVLAWIGRRILESISPLDT